MSSAELSPLDADGVERAVTAALEAIAKTSDIESLKQARIEFAGDRSPLALANRQMASVPGPDKASAGKRMGSARSRVNTAIFEREALLGQVEAARVLAEEGVDVSLVTQRYRVGARHPLELLRERVCEVFVAMGWEIAEGPEIEAEWFNFDALNFDPDHPARQMQDTFYVEPQGSGLVLRTHTSPVQARALLERDVPVYVLAPGKTFRTDELDATHTPVFHQFEGLAIDRGLTMAHLKGTLDHFAATMFGPQAVTRLRPSFFPFTEPSAEMDLQCFVCVGVDGTPDPSCRTCGGTGWIEWGGCGMVHPNVLLSCGIDPEEFTGFAFGMGVERTLMFRHGVADMHDIVEGDIRFSLQFGMEI